ARVYPNGRPGLRVSAPGDGAMILITIGEAGEPRLWLYERGSDDPRIGLMVDRDGVAALDLWGRERGAGINVWAEADGRTTVALWGDEDQAPRVNIDVDATGSGRVRLYDIQGECISPAPDPAASAAAPDSHDVDRPEQP